MIHYNIETVMKEAEEGWERFNMGKSGDQKGKLAYMLGHLKTAYEKSYKDLPNKNKPATETNTPILIC